MTISPVFTQQLQKLKEHLLDLTYRSPFLSFRATESKSLRVVEESPAELLRLLYEDQKTMLLCAWTEDKGKPPEARPFALLDEGPLEEHHLDTTIQTSVTTAEKLHNTAKTIWREANDYQEEKGVNLLYLALGMLEYKVKQPSQDEKTYLAPLLLLPISLSTKGTDKAGNPKWQLQASGEDVVINLTLCRKLSTDFGVYLPEQLDDSSSLYDGCLAWFRNAATCVQDKSGFRVLADCYLGFFNFQKYALFKDMETHAALYEQHPVLQALCDPNSYNLNQPQQPDLQSFGDRSLDACFPPERAFHVLDSDSSQQEAILLSQQGHHLIIEGPPGTGKSQTIANIISNTLAQGKTVLFVSEKQAALEVVYRRLEEVGLSSFCLELHSSQANRKAIMNHLQESLDNQLKEQKSELPTLQHRLPKLRSALNQYVQQMHQTDANALELSPFQGIGRSVKLQEIPKPFIRFPDLTGVTPQTLDESIEALGQLEEALHAIGSPAQHPWAASQRTYYGLVDKQQLQGELETAKSDLSSLLMNLKQASEELGIRVPLHLAGVEELVSVAQTLLDSPTSSPSVLASEAWNERPQVVSQLIQRGRAYQAKLESLQSTFTESWFQQPVEFHLQWLKEIEGFEKQALTRWFRPAYYQLMKTLRAFLISSKQPNPMSQWVAWIKMTISWQEHKADLQGQDVEGATLFGRHWQGILSNWSHLEQFSDWMVQFRHHALTEHFEKKAFDLAANGNLQTDVWQPRLEKLRQEAQSVYSKLQQLAVTMEFSDSKLLATLSDPLDRLVDRMVGLIQELPRLDAWCHYLSVRQRVIQVPLLKAYVDHPEVESQYAATLVDSFKAIFYQQWVAQQLEKKEALKQFSPTEHSTHVSQFQDMDGQVTRWTRYDLLKRLQANKNHAFAEADNLTRTYLQTQLRKTRQGDSVRAIFKKAATLIFKLKPCFMMSPLSVAEFIDPSKITFDLVIFDEASQVRPAEALAAIVRGRQVIVVGDSKQLPPTNFFAKQLADTETPDASKETEDDPGLMEAMVEESILEQCYKAGFLSRMLKWHYRSRHESLITFSNSQFYKNLLTFPSADQEASGLTFQFVEQGIYEGEGSNTIEAMTIVQAIKQHANLSPHLSLGVATFGVKQRIIILDLLDKEKAQDPQLARFLESCPRERFFVKNLESVQGDERDVIFISSTYGRNRDGKLLLNFGPINGKQGWRRLNVIATRARLSLKVFASFRSDELDPTRLNNEGARLFRQFLAYAEKGTLGEVINKSEIMVFDSPFEEQVFNALTNRGYKCLSQVGQSGYRIDIGVLDHDIEGLFIAGVECDGASYHSALSARDRDRNRQAILERLGWTMIRVWSTGWFQNQEAELEKLLQQLEQARQVSLERRQQRIDEQMSRTVLIEEVDEHDNPTDFMREGYNDPDGFQAKTVIFSDYRSVTPRLLGSLETLVLDRTLLQVMKTIVETEAPIHQDELARAVIAHWGVKRLTTRIQGMTAQALQQLLNSGESYELRGDFVFRKGQVVEPRYRGVLANLPKPDGICLEELEAGLLAVLPDGIIVPESQLIQATLKAFGYGRSALRDKLVLALQSLLDKQMLLYASYGIQKKIALINVTSI